MERDIVVFDTECREDPTVVGWDNTDKLGLTVGVVYEVRSRSFRVFGAEQIEQLRARLEAADLIVGFNSATFDMSLVYGVERTAWSDGPGDKPSTGRKWWDAKSVDLLEDIWAALGKREKGWGLDTVCRATLGNGKTEGVDGAKAPEMWKAGRQVEVIDYCIRDTMLTRDLWEFASNYGFVVGGIPERMLRLRRK